MCECERCNRTKTPVLVSVEFDQASLKITIPGLVTFINDVEFGVQIYISTVGSPQVYYQHVGWVCDSIGDMDAIRLQSAIYGLSHVDALLLRKLSCASSAFCHSPDRIRPREVSWRKSQVYHRRGRKIA